MLQLLSRVRLVVPALPLVALVALISATAPAARADEAPEPPKNNPSKCAGGDASDFGLIIGIATITARVAARRKANHP